MYANIKKRVGKKSGSKHILHNIGIQNLEFRIEAYWN